MLVDRIQYGDRRPLDDLVFKGGDPERILLAIRLPHTPLWDGITQYARQ